MTKEQALQECTVDGNVVKLPTVQLDPKTFKDVKKAIENIGGKWKGGKVFGFVFADDPTDLLTRVQNGEDVNLQQDFQFFATPKSVAKKLAEMAGHYGLYEQGCKILEPSAGQGALVEALLELNQTAEVLCVELMDTNVSVLKRKGFNVIKGDFLTVDLFPREFDLIVANPPFSKNQDIDHVLRMFDCLDEGCEIITLMSTHWLHCDNKKELAFREFAEQKAIYQEILPAGTFKESGTMIETIFMVFRK